MLKHSAAAGLALALVTGSAFAADLPSHKVPIIVPPPAFSWTGLYGGVNIGYGFGDNDSIPGAHAFYTPFPVPTDLEEAATWLTNANLNGVVGGGQIGYAYQFSPWLVLGAEADIQGSGLSSQAYTTSTPDPGLGGHFGIVTASQNVDWYGSVRGRIGVAPFDPRLLIFATGGLAYGQVRHGFTYSDVFPSLPGILFGAASVSETKVGWTVGGGVEWALAFLPNLSAKIEYDFTDLGGATLTAPGVFNAGLLPGSFFVATHNPQTRFHTVRVGLNWHFNPFTPAPVLAKY